MARPSRPRHADKRKPTTTKTSIGSRPGCQKADQHRESPQTCKPKDHCRRGAGDPADLYDRYLAILQEVEEADWKCIWELMVTHPWFLNRVEQCSRTVIRKAALPAQLADDVQQEVILNFATKLQRIPDLCIDRDRAKNHFAGWMHTIILRECQMATRTLRRLHARTLPLLIDKAEDDARELRDARMDLQEALSQLDADDASAVLLHLQGCEVKEIAAALDVSLSTAYRVLRRANDRLGRKLR